MVATGGVPGAAVGVSRWGLTTPQGKAALIPARRDAEDAQDGQTQ
jgi:hypothetical protein